MCAVSTKTSKPKSKASTKTSKPRNKASTITRAPASATEANAVMEYRSTSSALKSISKEALDYEKVASTLGSLDAAGYSDIPHVLTQSPQSGTLAIKGTSVDIVLALPNDIGVGVFKGAHSDLAEKKLGDFEVMMNDGEVIHILEEYQGNEDKIPPEDVAKIQSHAAAAGINLTVGETADKSAKAMLVTLNNIRGFY